MKSCKSCGCVNLDINRYCRNCGKPFGEETEFVAPAGQADLQPKVTPTESVATPPAAEEPQRDFFEIIGEEAAEPGVLPQAPTTPAPLLFIDFDNGDHGEDELMPAMPYVGFGGTDTPETEETEADKTDVVGQTTRSFAFVAGMFMLTCALTLCAVKVALGFDSLYDELRHWMYIFGFDRAGVIRGAAFTLPFSLLFRLAALFPLGFCAVGGWMHLYCFRKGKQEPSTVGLSVMTVGGFTALLINVLTAASALIFAAYTIPMLGGKGEEVPRAVGTLIYLSVFVIYYALCVVYGILLLRTLGKAKKICAGIREGAKAPVFLVVAHLGAAVLRSAASGFYLAGYDTVSFARCVAEMLMLIFFAMTFIKFRILLKENT